MKVVRVDDARVTGLETAVLREVAEETGLLTVAWLVHIDPFWRPPNACAADRPRCARPTLSSRPWGI